MLGDEYYENPINTYRKCDHDVPLKINCKDCEYDKKFYLLDYQLKNINSEMGKLKNHILELTALFERLLKVVEQTN